MMATLIWRLPRPCKEVNFQKLHSRICGTAAEVLDINVAAQAYLWSWVRHAAVWLVALWHEFACLEFLAGDTFCLVTGVCKAGCFALRPASLRLSLARGFAFVVLDDHFLEMHAAEATNRDSRF